MTKAEIKKVPDNVLIVDYINTYAEFCVNMNIGRGTKKLYSHWCDLDKEIIKRGILTEEQVAFLHS